MMKLPHVEIAAFEQESEKYISRLAHDIAIGFIRVTCLWLSYMEYKEHSVQY